MPEKLTQPLPAEKQEVSQARQFVNFRFFRVDPLWRRLTEGQKENDRKEFSQVAESFRPKGVSWLSYSMIGIRGDADFLLWRMADSPDLFQEMSSAFLHTGLGKYLLIPYSYLSMTKPSPYVAKHSHPGQEGRRTQVTPAGYKYLFLYPFTKSDDWYRLPREKRQQMMEEHFKVGHKYPSVKNNTSYSFGLDDQEFMVAFESDFPGDFLDLVTEMREIEARRYTLRDTPIFTAIKKPLETILKEL